MFNVRLSYATVFPTRRYTLQSAWRSPSVSVGRYLGPSLDYILPATSKDEPPVLAVVEVPGLPEVQPPSLLLSLWLLSCTHIQWFAEAFEVT